MPQSPGNRQRRCCFPECGTTPCVYRPWKYEDTRSRCDNRAHGSGTGSKWASGILLTGSLGIGQAEISDEVFTLAEAHDWLFPRMAAVVHHGGAGTTAAGLRAGVPTIITPIYGDQFFWGQGMTALGLAHLPYHRNT